MTPSQVMVQQWGFSQGNFYHMQPGASPAGFVTLLKGQERQLKIMTAEECIWVTFHEEDCLCIHHADATTATDTVVNSASAYSFILTLRTGTTRNICEL